MRGDIAALIPAYQAATTVGAVVSGARAHFARVLVVDDGSGDATGERAAAAGAEVIRHAVNGGKGAALRTGLEALAAGGVRCALTLDADGQHLAEEIPTLLAASRARSTYLRLDRTSRIQALTFPKFMYTRALKASSPRVSTRSTLSWLKRKAEG